MAPSQVRTCDEPSQDPARSRPAWFRQRGAVVPYTVRGSPCARSSTDRASDYGSEGWGFESLRARQPGQRPVASCGGAFSPPEACLVQASARVAPPPGDIRVQRGADHPRCRSRMPGNRPPRCPGPGNGFGHQILRPVLVTDTSQDSAKALIPGLPVELREVQLLGSHIHLTHDQPDVADTARAQSDGAEIGS